MADKGLEEVPEGTLSSIKPDVDGYALMALISAVTLSSGP